MPPHSRSRSRSPPGLTSNKDLRKFLDGIYVSGKGTVVTVET